MVNLQAGAQFSQIFFCLQKGNHHHFAMSSLVSRATSSSLARGLLERAGGSLGLLASSSMPGFISSSRSYGVGLPAPKESEPQRTLDDGPAMSRAEFQTSQKQPPKDFAYVPQVGG